MPQFKPKDPLMPVGKCVYMLPEELTSSWLGGNSRYFGFDTGVRVIILRRTAQQNFLNTLMTLHKQEGNYCIGISVELSRWVDTDWIKKISPKPHST